VLVELLQRLVSEEIMTLEDLARRMEISPPLLEQMLQDLMRGGYIEDVASSCDTGCTACQEHSVCALVQGKRIWRLTDKGFRLARGSQSATHPA
jgi:hypothetical protein